MNRALYSHSRLVLLASLLVPPSFAIAEGLQSPAISVPLQGALMEGATGINRIQVRRNGVATFYDLDSDSLHEAKANEPRFQSFAWYPAGARSGLLIEAPATNYLGNSSFESELQTWKTEGKLVATDSNLAFHGKKAIRLSGRGTIFHSAFIPLPKGAKILGSGTFGSLSAYCTTGQGNAEGTIRPVVFGLDGNRRGKNLIKDYRFVRMGTGKWRRLVGRFELLRPGTAYVAGFQILKDVPLVLDAAQLEANHLPWTASSYIPTGNGPSKREVEVCRIGASTFPISRGTVSFWHRPTNPYYRMGYLFVHGPFDNKDRLYLHGGAAFLGVQRSRWAKRIDHLPDADGWHLFALTWDGRTAIQYFDGLEFGEKEGPFTYSGLEKFGGHFLLGSNGGTQDVGAEGVIADLNVWNTPLPADEVLRIWKGERTGSTTRSVVKKGSGPQVGGAKNEIAVQASRETNLPRNDGPVTKKPLLTKPAGELPSATFELSSKARTTVGIYDLDGTLHRQLLLGEVKDAGKHRLLWNGRNDSGQMLPAGDYEYRVVSNNLAAEWKETVGNSGDPPWGKTAVRGGLFKALEKVGNDIVATNPLAEGNHGVQRFDPNGKVVWTSEIDPVYAYMTALAADEKFVYIAGLIRNERDARGQLYREAVWRLDAATGRNSPWEQGNVIDLNEARVAPPGRRLFDQYHNGDERYKDPLPGFEIHDMEVAGGGLYISFRREGSVRVLDLETGRLETLIKGIPAPKGIAIHGQSLFVVSGKRVLRFSLRGEPTGTAIEGLEAPYEVETDSAENLYVTDLGESQQVKVFSRDGKLQRTFGPPRGGRIKDGSTERLFLPTGIAVHEGGRTSVADFGNGRIVTYDERGKRVVTIEAAGFGGMDGGVSFVPGDPKMLFMSNIHVFGTLRNLNIVAYRTASAGGNWKTAYRWPDLTPVFSQEPLYARKLRNSRTYLFLLARNPSWFELMPDGRLVFCGALLHPLDYRIDTTLSPAVKKAAKSLGLLNEAGLPRCRMSWIDHNRNLKLEEGEITLQESDTRPFYTVNDASVSTEGSLHLKDYLTSTYWRFDLKGFDAAGNPLYDWKSAEKIWDLKDYPQLQGKRWMLIASEADSEGSLYFSHLKGISPCIPSSVRLLKFDRKGVLKWNVGRKARGLKDKPGEFMSVICLAGIKRGIVFALEYEGRVDLYTTDGLYLATLLNGTIEDDTPYANWGENFAGDVVEDPKTGDLLFVINTHNYRLPIFKVTGLETIKRTTGKVTLTEPMRAWLAQQPGKVGEKKKQKMTFIYHLGKGRITIDGKLDEWKGIPHTTATFPDERSKDHHARARAGSDGENLYLAYSVGDPTPAVNRCTAPSVLWDGDCLELYLSPNIDLHAPWKKGDHIIHFSATEDKKKTPVGVLHRTVKTWATPPGIVRGVRIWQNGRGYDLEAKIPFRALGMSSLQLGQLIHLDWDFTYGGKDGKVSFKLAWTDVGHRVLNDPNSWAFGRYVQKVGGENEIFVASASMIMDDAFDGWQEIPVQSRIEISESEDQFRSELKAASDEKFLYLYFDVADPNPAKVTPGASWVGTGDHIEMFVGSHRIYIPASPAFNSPYILQGAKAEKITESRMNLQTKKNGDGYELAIAIPWTAIGGKQASLKFNWQVGWSDASGGSIFTVQPWLPWGKESGMLRSAE